jgi:hypothetical protein
LGQSHKALYHNYLRAATDAARVLLQAETICGQEHEPMLTQEQKIQAFALLAITVGLAILGI